MKTIGILFASAIALAAASSAMADDYSVAMRRTMKAKLAAGGNTVPTGIDVPGPTFYVLKDGRVIPYSSSRPARHAKVFWDRADRESQGSTGASGGDSGGSGTK